MRLNLENSVRKTKHVSGKCLWKNSEPEDRESKMKSESVVDHYELSCTKSVKVSSHWLKISTYLYVKCILSIVG